MSQIAEPPLSAPHAVSCSPAESCDRCHALEAHAAMLQAQLNGMLQKEQGAARLRRLAALGEMSARLAHQVRTPLSSALLYLSHLQWPLAKADTEATVARLREHLGQIDNLVDSMLRFLRDGGEERQDFSLNQLLSELRDALALQLLEAGASLELHLPEDDCRLRGDRQALHNALVNLVENALQAATASPRVRLSLVREPDCYTISVEDNGRGIAPALRERIFTPFFSTRPQGNGLGLSVVLSAVRAHGGDVRLEQAAQGGTVFLLTLPHDGGSPRQDAGLWHALPQRSRLRHLDREHGHDRV